VVFPVSASCTSMKPPPPGPVNGLSQTHETNAAATHASTALPPARRTRMPAFAVVTDSGGLQEETTALGIPCFTLRDNTERPVTVTEGTNVLVRDPSAVAGLVSELTQRKPQGRIPEGWDGHAAERIVQALAERDR